MIIKLLGCSYYPILYSTCKLFQTMITWGTWLPERCMDEYVSNGFFRLARYAARSWSWNIEAKSLFRSIRTGVILKVKVCDRIPSSVRYCGNSTWMHFYAIATMQQKKCTDCTKGIDDKKFRKGCISLLEQGLIDELQCLLQAVVDICKEHFVVRGIAESLLAKAKELRWPSVCEWLWTSSPINSYFTLSSLFPRWIYESMDYAYLLSYMRRCKINFLTAIPWEKYIPSGFGNGNQLLLDAFEPWVVVRREMGRSNPQEERHNSVKCLLKALENNDIDIVRHYHEKLKSSPYLDLVLPVSIREPTVEIASWMHQNCPRYFQDPETVTECLGISVQLNEWLATNFQLSRYSLPYYTAKDSNSLSDERIDAIVHWMAYKWQATIAEKVQPVWKVMAYKPRQFANACTKYGLDRDIFREWLWLLLEDTCKMQRVNNPDLLKERVTAYIDCFDLPLDFALKWRQTAQESTVLLKRLHQQRALNGLSNAFCYCVERSLKE